MNIMIVGAQLNNKGAESMLFTSVYELQKKYPESDIFFATNNEYDTNKYCFKKLYYTDHNKTIALGGVRGLWSFVHALFKDSMNAMKRRDVEFNHYFDVKRIIKDVDLIIDVSGFAIGNKWDINSHKSYIKNIELAMKYDIPIYLMPQSFGPFEYDKKMSDIKEKLKEVLKYPSLIMAREKDGYNELVNNLGLNNVIMSCDLVLQSRGIDIDKVYVNPPNLTVPIINGKKVVGVIPNVQCFAHGSTERNINLYRSVINKLIEDGYSVILFRHSKEDLKLCEMIYDSIVDDNNSDYIHLQRKEFSSLEYDAYVRGFSFIICSRYHGLVHALRNYIPCIALGWAVKYRELMETVGQEEYVFDITNESFDTDCVLQKIELMEKNISKNSEIIKEKLDVIQLDNCFDKIEVI
ncbi:MAG: polysaccharide pyruvyl transferase family protein [Lachnospiraceae bacterium]|nr:polysaccharide pyruvyl transferase family protein [Lachnospiraceae bacterium]